MQRGSCRDIFAHLNDVRDSLGMKDRERLALLTVASDVRGDIEDDFDEMCFGEPPSVAACIDEPNDPWHMNWNVTFRDAFFLSKDSDGSFQLKCVYNMSKSKFLH